MQQALSASALAKKLNVSTKELLTQLKHANYITWHDSKWLLTDTGRRFGGHYVESEKYGRFIVWPPQLVIDENLISDSPLTATQVGAHFDLPAKKINLLFNELGWINREDQQWVATPSGIRAGAIIRHDSSKQSQYNKQSQYVVWHASVVRNVRLKQTVHEFKGTNADRRSTDQSLESFREKFSAKFRTLDGHYVQSQGELVIDNWLYMAGLLHAYHRQLPIDADIVSDFYLPQSKIYIQFWPEEKSEKQLQQRQQIRQVYQDNNFHLIELYPNDLHDLDEKLPKLLREFGVYAY
ncbi:glycerol kinase [Vibrio hippocampi]|uniref:YTH domain-containing protein n=1 Tax=Vibrio hippocampi TaxID=654686 RepID=A0ABN8DRD9_9VIBR|nr:glycerol kinase [Vibrio hippocampi]CAH0530351.1 hypothetical protein VHP8226_03994 [Vibrio hippocampi]